MENTPVQDTICNILIRRLKSITKKCGGCGKRMCITEFNIDMDDKVGKYACDKCLGFSNTKGVG